MKALVGAFKQEKEKALVGAFSVIVKTDCETGGALHSTNPETVTGSSAADQPASTPPEAETAGRSSHVPQQQQQSDRKISFRKTADYCESLVLCGGSW